MARVGPYRVIRALGRGGEGAVLLAFDPRLQRHVALKHHRLPAARLARRRALQEARRCAAIDHARVPRVYDLLATGRELLLVLQYVPGCDLETVLQRRRAAGLGPLTVGILSDAYANQFGDDNLRYAMATTLTISLVGAGFLWMGARSLKRDLETNRVALSAVTGHSAQ